MLRYMDQSTVNRLNLATIKLFDPFIKEIVKTGNHVELFLFSVGEKKWRKSDVRGQIFIYKRQALPAQCIFIYNQLTKLGFIEPIELDMVVLSEPNLLMYKKTRNRFCAIAFLNTNDCDEICRLIRSIMNKMAYEKGNSANKGLRNMKAVPTIRQNFMYDMMAASQVGEGNSPSSNRERNLFNEDASQSADFTLPPEDFTALPMSNTMPCCAVNSGDLSGDAGNIQNKVGAGVIGAEKSNRDRRLASQKRSESLAKDNSWSFSSALRNIWAENQADERSFILFDIMNANKDSKPRRTAFTKNSNMRSFSYFSTPEELENNWNKKKLSNQEQQSPKCEQEQCPPTQQEPKQQDEDELQCESKELHESKHQDEFQQQPELQLQQQLKQDQECKQEPDPKQEKASQEGEESQAGVESKQEEETQQQQKPHQQQNKQQKQQKLQKQQKPQKQQKSHKQQKSQKQQNEPNAQHDQRHRNQQRRTEPFPLPSPICGPPVHLWSQWLITDNICLAVKLSENQKSKKPTSSEADAVVTADPNTHSPSQIASVDTPIEANLGTSGVTQSTDINCTGGAKETVTSAVVGNNSYRNAAVAGAGFKTDDDTKTCLKNSQNTERVLVPTVTESQNSKNRGYANAAQLAMTTRRDEQKFQHSNKRVNAYKTHGCGKENVHDQHQSVGNDLHQRHKPQNQQQQKQYQQQQGHSQQSGNKNRQYKNHQWRGQLYYNKNNSK